MFDKSDIQFFAAVMCFLSVVIGLFVWGFSYRCKRFSEVTGRRTHYELTLGCLVEVKGELVPFKTWRNLDGEAHEN